MIVFVWAMPFDFAQPRWLWLALLAPLLVVASIRSLAGLDAARRTLSLVVRSTLVVLVACIRGMQAADGIAALVLSATVTDCVEGFLYPIPALVAIHAEVATTDCRDVPALVRSKEGGEFLQRGFRAARR